MEIKLGKVERACNEIARSRAAYLFLVAHAGAPKDCFGCSATDLAVIEVRQCLARVDALNIRAFPKWSNPLKQEIAEYRNALEDACPKA